MVIVVLLMVLIVFNLNRCVCGTRGGRIFNVFTEHKQSVANDHEYHWPLLNRILIIIVSKRGCGLIPKGYFSSVFLPESSCCVSFSGACSFD